MRVLLGVDKCIGWCGTLSDYACALHVGCVQSACKVHGVCMQGSCSLHVRFMEFACRIHVVCM